MREPGFEEFADLWQGSGEGEREAFDALARKARRQGRLMAYLDYALVAVIVVGTLIGMLVTPHPAMIVAALLLIVATFWLTWKRRQLRQMTKALSTQGRADFLESSIRIANSNLRRVRLSLATLPAFVAMGLSFRIIRTNGGHFDHVAESIADWAQSPRGVIGMTVVTVIAIGMIRSHRKLKAELRMLRSLRRDYEEESQREEEINYPHRIP